MFTVLRGSFKDLDLFLYHLKDIMTVGDDLEDFASVEIRISGNEAPVVFMKDREDKVILNGDNIVNQSS